MDILETLALASNVALSIAVLAYIGRLARRTT